MQQSEDHPQHVCHLPGLGFMAWRKLDIFGMGSLPCASLFAAYPVRLESPIYGSTCYLASFAADSMYLRTCCLRLDSFPRRDGHTGMGYHPAGVQRQSAVGTLVGILEIYRDAGFHVMQHARVRMDSSGESTWL